MDARSYTPSELTGLIMTIRDMLKDASLPKEHFEDVARANPFLLPLVEMLGTERWKEIISFGKVNALHFGSTGSATIKLEYPIQAIACGKCTSLPLGFHFALQDGGFIYKETTMVQWA